MSDKQITNFSGMLNKAEFKERYVITIHRINNGYSREDMSFLLGKPSYHVIDYEMLSNHVKMDTMDYEVIGILFRAKLPIPLFFNTREFIHDISKERKMIRGSYCEYEHESHYQYNLPWVFQNPSQPLTVNATIERDTQYDEEIEAFITSELNALLNIGYFNQQSSPLMIYLYLRGNIDDKWSSSFLPMVKKVMYEFIRKGKLQIKNESGHIYYKKGDLLT